MSFHSSEASAFMRKRSEELGFSLTSSDSANLDRIAGDCHHNAATTPLPVVSMSPFPHQNMNETSQYYSQELAGGNSNIASFHFKSSQNFQMDGNNLYKTEEHKSLPCRPDSGFPCTEGYIGWPYQYTRHDNLTISDDMLNLNSLEKPDSGGKCVIPTDSSASRPQIVSTSQIAMSNIGQPLLHMNLGVTQFNPNQAGAEPLLTPGKLDERFVTVGSGSNKESKSNNIMPKGNVTGNSERVFFPPINTYHNQLGSRSCLNPGFDMNGAFTGFRKDSGTLSDLAHTGGHEGQFNCRTGLHLGPSYGFQRPAVGDQNHYVKQINRHLGLGGVKDMSMEFADVGHKNGFERSMAVPSFPFVGSQTMPCESRQSRANGHLVPSSIGMVTDQSPFELLPENNGKFSSQSFARPPLVMATRSSRGQDPLGNNGQSQVVGSIQQSSSRLGQHYASGHGIQTGKGNMTVQVSRPPTISSLKRAASQPLPSTVQGQRRKTLTTQPFIHPSVPTWTRLAPSVPNTPQSIPPLIHVTQSPAPQAIQSSVSPLFPTTWTKSALSVPNTNQTIPPLIAPAPSLPPIDNRTSSFRPSSHPPPFPNQQLIAQSLARLRTPLIPPPPLPNQQLIAQSLSPPPLPNQQLIAQSLARKRTPLIPPPPLPNQQLIAQSLARKRTPLIPPPPLPNQQLIAQSLARQRTLLIPPPRLIPPPTNITRNHVKYKDQTPEPHGYKCLLCKRDLSYAPEGPITQPTVPPTAAVLSCGHTFHEYCLERITPDDQSNDPPCIPCALRD